MAKYLHTQGLHRGYQRANGCGANGSIPGRILYNDELHITCGSNSMRAKHVKHFLNPLLRLYTSGSRPYLAFDLLAPWETREHKMCDFKKIFWVYPWVFPVKSSCSEYRSNSLVVVQHMLGWQRPRDEPMLTVKFSCCKTSFCITSLMRMVSTPLIIFSMAFPRMLYIYHLVGSNEWQVSIATWMNRR